MIKIIHTDTHMPVVCIFVIGLIYAKNAENGHILYHCSTIVAFLK